jgi:hypothetical protein
MISTVTISSKVQKANTSNSVRTTLPNDIVKELDIGIGDLLIWNVEDQNGKKIVKMKKVEI